MWLPLFLTNFNTELGRLHYTVLPFGVTVAGDVFHCKLDQCFGKIRQVIVIANDIMIVGYKQNHSDHDQALTTLLETARRCDVKLNYEKLQYKKGEVDFFGETYTTAVPNQIKIKYLWLLAMPSLTNRKQVQSFIGMINYLSKFSPWLSEIADPIRELAIEKAPFSWGPEHQSGFTQMKKEIASAPVLAYYNPKKQTVLKTGTSIKGCGVCLLQDEKPVYFASKSITDMQEGYVATELELLAFAWAMEKFHYFLYASHFILETDQKPLEAILSRNINQATPRLWRILIRTFPYHFTVQYIPGLTNQLADYLSHLGGQRTLLSCPHYIHTRLPTSCALEVTV